jgi:hypothetical protein
LGFAKRLNSASPVTQEGIERVPDATGIALAADHLQVAGAEGPTGGKNVMHRRIYSLDLQALSDGSKVS